MRDDLLALPDPTPGEVFALAKLYADCVAPSGEAAIVYAGALTWNGFRLSLSGLTFFDRDGNASESWALSRGSVSLNGRELRWSHGDSKLLARASCDGFRQTLLTTPAGSVAFDCIVPDGAITVTRGSRVLEGRGYVERLALTIPPWSLPIDSFRWGRLATPAEQFVWIEWRGAHPLTRVFRGGVACEGAVIRDDRIEMPGELTLMLGSPLVLRTGRLDGMRGAISRLIAQLPGIAGIHETKWLRSGRALLGDRVVAEGWVIDEEVRLR